MANTTTNTSSEYANHTTRLGSGARAGEGAGETGLDASRWVVHGAVAGVLGAAVVAVFFLMIDIAAGRPFWTPTALGAAVFRGESLAPGSSPDALLIVAYTMLHGVFFLVVSWIAAQLLADRARPLAPAGLTLAALFFAILEFVFLVFSAVFELRLMSEYGFGTPAAANLLAAGSMAAYLTRFVHVRADAPLEEAR